MAGKFVLKKTTNGQFHFNLKAANGEIILSSQRYQSKAGAENGIESVRSNSTVPERYQRELNAAGKHYFNLTAANGQIIGTSEAYSSKQAMENGITSVSNNAPDAKVEDLT